MDNGKVNVVKLVNNQYNMVHYYQYYDFETIGDIRKDIERKYKDYFKKLFENKEEFSIHFDKHKDLNVKLSSLQHNHTIHYSFQFEDKKNDQHSNNDQKKHK